MFIFIFIFSLRHILKPRLILTLRIIPTSIVEHALEATQFGNFRDLNKSLETKMRLIP